MAEDVEYFVSIAPGHADSTVFGVCCADCHTLGFYSGGSEEARGHGWRRHAHAAHSGWVCVQCSAERAITVEQAIREERDTSALGSGIMIEMGWGYR